MEKDDFVRVPLFDGSNYPAWKYRMLVVLEEHELTECISREIAEVEELKIEVSDTADVRADKKKQCDVRKKKDRRCKSLLISRIHDNQLEYVQDQPTPKAIWSALQRVFERKSIASRLHLKRKMLTLRHERGSLQEHFLVFDKIVREYKSTGAQIDDLDVVCHLLLTLGPAFATVVTALETMPEENLTIEFVKCRLLDEEIKQKSGGVEASLPAAGDSAAFSGASKKKPGQHQKKQFKCFGCHKEGHKLSECPEKKNKGSKKSSAHLGEENGVCFAGARKLSSREVGWIVDSGSSEHLTNDKSLFKQLTPMKCPMQIAVAKEGECIVAKQHGEVKLYSQVNGKSIPITLKNVLYIPEARVNLLSVRKMEMAGLKVMFADGKVSIERESGAVAVGNRRGKLYELDLYRESVPEESSHYSCGRIPKGLEIWHRRYGHLSGKNLKLLMRNEMVIGMKAKIDGKFADEIVCEPCIVGKQSRKPFSVGEERRSTRVLELIHSDVCGPVTPVGVDGEKYFVTFIDDWSRFTVVCLISSKDQVVDVFREYEAIVSAKFGRSISRFRCDNGTEYKNRAFLQFCKEKGVQIEWTVPYTPEQNGTSERMNRTLVEKTRSMLQDSGVSSELWGTAVQTAAFLANRSPASAIGEKKTPFEMWEGKKPNVEKLRVFGSKVFVHIPKELRKKLDGKSWKGVFVGYSNNGYRVWDPRRKQIVVARDVIFVEESGARQEDPESSVGDSGIVRVPVCSEESDASEDEREAAADPASEHEDEEEQSDLEQDEENNDAEYESCGDDTLREESSQEVSEEAGSNQRPRRNRHAPSWHSDYDMNITGYALNATSYVENLPSTLREMRERADWPKWKAAVREEIDALERNNTWTLVKLPERRTPISCKWVFRVKRSENGEEDRYKARLVARGFTQRHGFDYSETYSPVAKLDTLRAVLAIANKEKMTVHQMDVKSAFLNGSISEEIYMTQPEGHEKGKNLVCKLNKSLYGLKQASRAWNERFHSFVERLGFRRSTSDQCLYVKGTGQNQVFLVLYVDDVLLIGRHLKLVEVVKKCLSTEFEMTDVGEVNCFLGMKIERNVEKRELRISQRSFLEGLLKRFNMSDCKPISTPMECRLRLKKGEESMRTDKPYRELVGCLMYVTLTSRPDLCAAVNYFSQFQSCPTEEHWVHLKRILRYVRGTIDLGLVFRGDDKSPAMEAYSDADWANDLVDRRSLTGSVFRVHGCTVSWLTRKQPTVSLSSTEAELIALCVTVCHGIWMTRLLKELGVKFEEPIIYYEDNQSTIRVVEDERDVGRLKHIDVKFRFVRELIQRGQVAVQYVPSANQLADVMTKGLPSKAFLQHRTNLGLVKFGN